MKKMKILVTCCLVLALVLCPITGNATMERHPIEPLVLSEDPSIVPSENNLLLGLLQEDIRRYELAGDNTQREEDLKKLWLQAHFEKLSIEEILQRIPEIAEELLAWQRDEVSCYMSMDDASLTQIIKDSNVCYEGVYQILRALGINAPYLTLEEMRLS